jgi:hypothetical protein
VPVSGVQARPSIVLQASSPLAPALSLPGTPRLQMIRRLHPRLRHARLIHHDGNHDAPMVHPDVDPSGLKSNVTQTVAPSLLQGGHEKYVLWKQNANIEK